MRKKVNIFWSGGWDGTFRMLQLCQYDIDIQPIYIVDNERKSSEIEQNRINEIRNILNNRYKATILDILYYDKKWILENCENSEISNAYQFLKRKYGIGIQYEWFALLSKYLDNDKIECGVVHQYHGKVENAIEGEGSLISIDDDIFINRFEVISSEKQKTGQMSQLDLVFGNLSFPIIKLTKQDEEKFARCNNWMDVMLLSWFCQNPIKGQPCGICNPCDDAMHTGMSWRLPPKARIRNKFRFILYLILRIKRHIVKK